MKIFSASLQARQTSACREFNSRAPSNFVGLLSCVHQCLCGSNEKVKYRWSIAPPQPALAEFLAKQLKVSSLLAQCLLNRGFSEPEPISRFLEPRLKNLADPFLLPNMRAAVERLFTAHARSEPLVIFGDYDVDGVTSTALLVEILGALGWKVNYYL